ncbi:MAG: NAD-dependent epimerase/dehydratase family protein [Verrucomicrobiota bacterium]|nr:NAD-dependent epimerase/dehydratase family protein [Verrucomicrobiota bacterium]
MKILVTGGTGFTGSHLVRRLLFRGHEVWALDNQKGVAYEELARMGAQISIGSIADEMLLTRLVPDCEVIYHLAAAFRKVNLPRSAYWETNVTAMRRLLEIARADCVRKIVYCSTQGVHGNVDNPPGDETTPIRPEDYYQRTKYEGEKVAHEFMQRGMDITVLRPTAIYGPGDPGRFLMLFRQVRRGFFPFFGSGRALYHPLYIDNFMDAFELAAEKPAACGQTYIIADRRYYTIREIVEKIGAIMGVNLKIRHFPFWPLLWVSACVEFLFKPLPMDPPLFRRRADWFRQNRAFKTDKAARELGYNPAIDLDTGLKRTFDWYQANGYLA